MHFSALFKMPVKCMYVCSCGFDDKDYSTQQSRSTLEADFRVSFKQLTYKNPYRML